MSDAHGREGNGSPQGAHTLGSGCVVDGAAGREQGHKKPPRTPTTGMCAEEAGPELVCHSAKSRGRRGRQREWQFVVVATVAAAAVAAMVAAAMTAMVAVVAAEQQRRPHGRFTTADASPAPGFSFGAITLVGPLHGRTP
jgi:hypothetical protein